MKIRLALVVVLVLAGCSSEVTGRTAASPSPSASYSAENPMPGSVEDELGEPKPQDEGFKLGQVVNVGGWEVTVLSSQCGLTEMPSYDNGESGYYPVGKPVAGSVFCRVKMKTKNIGKRPASMSKDDQVAWSGDTLYSQYSSINNGGDNEGPFLGFAANPSEVGSGSIWFEVPTGTTLTEVEIHGNDALTNGTGKLISLSK